jgi:hypothetical protein
VTTAAGVLRALGEVVARMASGAISPDEAQTIAAVVAAPKAILEAQEVDRRLAELEARLARGERPPPQEGDTEP